MHFFFFVSPCPSPSRMSRSVRDIQQKKGHCRGLCACDDDRDMVTTAPRRSSSTLASFARAHDPLHSHQAAHFADLARVTTAAQSPRGRGKIYGLCRMVELMAPIRCRNVGLSLVALSVVAVVATVWWMTVANRVAVHQREPGSDETLVLLTGRRDDPLPPHPPPSQLRQSGDDDDAADTLRAPLVDATAHAAPICEGDVLAAGLFFPLVPIGVGPAVQRLLQDGCLRNSTQTTDRSNSASVMGPGTRISASFPRECLMRRLSLHDSSNRRTPLVFRKGGASGEWSGELLPLDDLLGRATRASDRTPSARREDSVVASADEVGDKRNNEALCVGEPQREAYVCIVLRHHRRSEDIGHRLRHTPVSSDMHWTHVIKDTIGPDEIYGSAVCRGAQQRLQHRPGEGMVDAAEVLPVGFAYLGFERSGSTDVYLAVLNLHECVNRPSATATVLQLRLVHEYDEFWGINEMQPTALRNAHKVLVEDSVTIPSTSVGAFQSQLRRGSVTGLKARARDTRATAAVGSLRPWCRGAPHERAVFQLFARGATTEKQRVPPPPTSPRRRYEPVRGSDALALTGWGCQYLSLALPSSSGDVARGGGGGETFGSASGSLRDWIMRLASPRTAAATHQQPSSATVSSLRTSWNILFVGDSQVRSLFWHWVAVMDNTEVVWTKVFNHTVRHGTSASEAPPHAAVVGSETVNVFATSTFLWDAYLRRMAQWHLDGNLTRMGKAYDVVVFGFGPWPASYGGYTLTDVRRVLEDLRVVALRLSNEYGVAVIHAGSPAWPKHRKNNPGFRITNTRLQLYHVLARRCLNHGNNNSANSAGVLWLPFFDASANMGKMKRDDGMHYDGSVVMFGLVDALATIITQQKRVSE